MSGYPHDRYTEDPLNQGHFRMPAAEEQPQYQFSPAANAHREFKYIPPNQRINANANSNANVIPLPAGGEKYWFENQQQQTYGQLRSEQQRVPVHLRLGQRAQVQAQPQRDFYPPQAQQRGQGAAAVGVRGAVNVPFMNRMPEVQMVNPQWVKKSKDLSPDEPFELKKLNLPPETKKVQVEPGCICERKVRAIYCINCAYLDQSGKLRKSRVCFVHPNVKFSSDLVKCVDCKQEMLEEVEFTRN